MGKNDWVDAKKELPKNGQPVLCTMKTKNDEWWFGCCVFNGLFPWIQLNNANPVEWWQPIPNPPND